MAELYIVRFCLAEKFTLATTEIGGDRFFLLEDPVREIPGVPVEQWKLPKITAIPMGRYRLVIDVSDRLGRETPHLLDVPGYTGIRMHRGNTPADTEGCPIQGYSASILAGTVSQSTAAEAAYLEKLRALLKVEDAWITVKAA